MGDPNDHRRTATANLRSTILSPAVPLLLLCGGYADFALSASQPSIASFSPTQWASGRVFQSRDILTVSVWAPKKRTLMSWVCYK